MANVPSQKRVHTSMRGIQLNMEEMRSKNEDSVAVTGAGAQVRMNARGDSLVAGGRIDKRREHIEQDYATQLQGKVKQVDVRSIQVDTFETPAQAIERMKKEKEASKAKTEEKPVAPKKSESAEIFDTPNEGGKPGRKLIEKDD